MTSAGRSCRGAAHPVCSFWNVSLATVCLLSGTLTAHASPYYSVTDLGVLPASYQPSSSPTYQLVNGDVYNTAGTLAYPFVTTPKPSPDPYMSQLTNNGTAGSQYNIVLMNANGYLAGITTTPYNQEGIMPTYVAGAFYAKVGADGTLGPKTYFGVGYSAPEGRQDAYALSGMRIIDINAKDQILGVGLNGQNETMLYDIHNGTMINIFANIQKFNGGNIVEKVLALDDQGRILATGWGPNQTQAGVEHLLLLTPTGVSSDPVPVPEPSTLIVMALGFTAPALWRRWKARRHD